jgi:uncharacterized protein with GYD domain
MPKYLFQVAYTAPGVVGVLRGGGSARRAALEETVESLGGSLEAIYFALGETDAFIVADLPDSASAAAASLVARASGAAQAQVTVLLSPEDVDAATERAKEVSYRPPGH